MVYKEVQKSGITIYACTEDIHIWSDEAHLLTAKDLLVNKTW